MRTELADLKKSLRTKRIIPEESATAEASKRAPRKEVPAQGGTTMDEMLTTLIRNINMVIDARMSVLEERLPPPPVRPTRPPLGPPLGRMDREVPEVRKKEASTASKPAAAPQRRADKTTEKGQVRGP